MEPKLRITRISYLYYYLDDVEGYFISLTKLQKQIIAEMPVLKQQLPIDIAELAQPEKQDKYSRYIFLFSLFTFAKKVCEILEKPYHELADAIRKNENADEPKEELDKLLGALKDISFDDLYNDHATGLQELDKQKSAITYDWNVIYVPHGFWSFRDIIGTIQSNGLLDEGLLKDFLAEDCPTAPSIQELKR